MNNLYHDLWINIKLPWVIVAVTIIWIVASDPANADHHHMDEDVSSAIKAVNQKLVDCKNAGDTECASLQYTTDAVYMAPNLEPIKGRDAIKAGMVDDGTSVLRLIPDKIEVYGDTASERGIYATDTREGKHLDHGSYVVIWKRTDDGWKHHWDIFNTNMAGN